MKIPCWFLLLITTQKIHCFLNNLFSWWWLCFTNAYTREMLYFPRRKKSVVVVYEAPLMTYVVTASSAPLHKCAYIEYTKSQVSNVSYYRHRLGWLLAEFKYEFEGTDLWKVSENDGNWGCDDISGDVFVVMIWVIHFLHFLNVVALGCDFFLVVMLCFLAF